MRKSRRKPPYPRSILDHQAFRNALEERGLLQDIVAERHLQGFYQALHRHHYPTLQEFVATYKFYEALQQSKKKRDKQEDPATLPSSLVSSATKPLQNHISVRKNYNRVHLPKAFLDFLNDPDCGFVTITSRVAQQSTSSDGSTTKLVVELADGQRVESVIMRYTKQANGKGSYRASLCVSSQVGCAMGCTFCATGTMGLMGNLTCGEILEQVVHANRILSEECYYPENENDRDSVGSSQYFVRNLVFMGMGEPLDNYANVVEACRALMDRRRWNIAHGRITVSTVGLISKIRKLTAEIPEVSLALSLHAPFQDLRAKIVPTAKHYSLESLIDALDDHCMAYQRRRRPLPQHVKKQDPKRRVMIEYVMLEGPTSTMECAHELGRLSQNRNLTVNLIRYNPTDVKDKLHCPSESHIQDFRAIVASYGTFCTVRRTMGADIASACGQLLQKDKERQVNEGVVQPAVQPDIEDYFTPPTSLPVAAKTDVMAKAKGPSDCRQTNSGTSGSNAPTSGLDEHKVLVWYLSFATALAASVFLISSALYIKQQRRR